MPEHEAFTTLQMTMLPFFISVRGLCVCGKLILCSATNYQEQCDQTLKIQLVCVFAVTMNSQKVDISFCTTMQWHIRNNSAQKETTQRESLAVERDFHIRKSSRVVFCKGPGSQDRNQGDTNEAKKGKQSANDARLVHSEILYIVIIVSSYKDCVCALASSAMDCSMKGKAVEIQKQ